VGSLIHVLLVEDDAEMADLVKINLRRSMDDDPNPSFDIAWAASLVEATIRLGQPGIDVVLLDLGLPELKGYKTYRVIQSASGYVVPVVILTSDERSISRDLTLGFGAAAYLLKRQSSTAQLKHALLDAVLHGRPARYLELN